jgi:hypothetical protein
MGHAGARHMGHAVSQFDRSRMGQPLCCLHSALVSFLSPLVAHAQKTPPSLSLSLPSTPSPYSSPSFMQVGLVLLSAPGPHLRCSLRLGFLLFVFFLSFTFLCCRLIDSLLQNPLQMPDLFTLCSDLMKGDIFLVLLLLPSFRLTPCCTIHSSCRICSLFARICSLFAQI